nr:immunoglobulin heavy chain junction region [Mus musculus]MBK4198472.1 immunoglobulin heavy chain junction region [Mus musculus]
CTQGAVGSFDYW